MDWNNNCDSNYCLRKIERYMGKDFKILYKTAYTPISQEQYELGKDLKCNPIKASIYQSKFHQGTSDFCYDTIKNNFAQ